MRKIFKNNLRSVLQHLYDNKEYSLIRKFCDSSTELKQAIYKNTDHIKGISNRYSQRIYHFINATYSVPKRTNGTILAFINLREGYTDQRESLYKIYVDNWNIYESILIPILKHSPHSRHKLVKTSKNIQKFIMKKTGGLPTSANLHTRVEYYTHQIFKPRYCKVCNKLITHFAHGLNVCSRRCAKGKIFESDKEMFNYLKNTFYSEKDTARKKLIQEIKRNKVLQTYIHKKTSKLFQGENKPIQQKVFHLINNIAIFPKCKVCKKKITKFNLGIYAYPATCSQQCNNSYGEHVIKRLSNAKINKFGYMLNTGKNEHNLLSIIQELSDAPLNKDKNITRYFPDATDEVNKIAYEINEKHHMHTKEYNRDLEKYRVYIKEGYKIFVLWDNINLKNKTYINRMTKMKKLFGENIRFGYYFDPEFKILTDNGLSNFIGILKRNSDNTKISIKLDKGKGSLKCTEDHLLFLDNDKTVAAKNLKAGDKIKTAHGEIQIETVKKIKDDKASYDVLQVEMKNRFYANKMLVHNCLIIDECVSGDTKVLIRDKIYRKEFYIKIEKLIPDDFDGTHYNNDKYEVMTPDGWSDFDGIRKHPNMSVMKIKCENNTELICSLKHKIYTNIDKYTYAYTLLSGDTLQGQNKKIKILDILILENNITTYDLFNVKKGSRYYTNNILSKNCAVIDTKLFSKFWQAIYPVVSSSKNSSVIMVSTPRGVGNFFYETYENARLDNSKDGWKAYRIDWWDFPGRDEEWKEKQLASFSGDETKFAREFGNCCSSDTILSILTINTNKKEKVSFSKLYNKLKIS